MWAVPNPRQRFMLQADFCYDQLPVRYPEYRRLFASLRWGEIIALTRQDPYLERRTVHVRRQFVTVPGDLDVGPPKSRAGLPVVSFPAGILPELHRHLDRFAGDGPSAWCSQTSTIGHSDGATSRRLAGPRSASGSALRICTYTTCGTPETRSPLSRGPACGT